MLGQPRGQAGELEPITKEKPDRGRLDEMDDEAMVLVHLAQGIWWIIIAIFFDIAEEITKKIRRRK